MKQLIFILTVFLVVGCEQGHKKKDFLGTWDIVSQIEIKTGKLIDPDSKILHVAKFTKDSLYIDSDIVHSWKVEGDSIFMDNSTPGVYIRELTSDKLVVEFEFFDLIQLILKRRE
ncbi:MULTISPECIES: hypothetical protein [Aestuariibaculum]|uniref:Lipocalin-like domain-containing protein n=1 Tax=Aestuariibaculum lutulentum TaxID=2920935 RepID=A0ABS9RIX4_9FLAO|nr:MULTISPECIES: hypothetical protein [Aestuariibaculum]MCH4552899.1 hypothetical protein [Aestuariibaculum lutulentum]MCR8669211.1 hypothetical protein [Aestuariibaculum sp. M13]